MTVEQAERTRRPVFHPLRVSDISTLTDDAVCITFAVPPELADDYDFVQGQHLTLRSLNVDGRVETVLSPAWTTDWMTETGKAKLTEYGIAPPTGRRAVGGPVALALTVRCPLCGSPDTTELSRFGSTSCKSLWRCNSCKEPFDHFKAI